MNWYCVKDQLSSQYIFTFKEPNFCSWIKGCQANTVLVKRIRDKLNTETTNHDDQGPSLITCEKYSSLCGTCLLDRMTPAEGRGRVIRQPTWLNQWAPSPARELVHKRKKGSKSLKRWLNIQKFLMLLHRTRVQFSTSKPTFCLCEHLSLYTNI